MIYIVIAMPIFIGFGGLAVDVGRLQMAKSQAQQVADAAARYAALGAANSSIPTTTAVANAQSVGVASNIDGSGVAISAADIIVGDYNSTTKVFTTNSAGNCVKVTVRQALNRTGSAPLMMSIFGAGGAQVTATAIAKCTSITTTISPPASGNLWLSGMPSNTTTQNLRPDNSTVWDNSGTAATGTAAAQRPLVIDLAAMGIQGGATINLEGITGTASWQSGSSGSNNTADGDAGFIVGHGVVYPGSVPTTSDNGLSNTRAPIGAVMAVFQSNSAPDGSGAPSSLDFGTTSDRDYTSVSPQLKQVFFIGDGKRDNGELQTITVPTGATKLYLGMMDAWQWNDNVGNFTTKLYGNNAVTLVK